MLRTLWTRSRRGPTDGAPADHCLTWQVPAGSVSAYKPDASVDDSRAARMHKRADIDGDGVVDYNELVRHIAPHKGPPNGTPWDPNGPMWVTWQVRLWRPHLVRAYW